MAGVNLQAIYDRLASAPRYHPMNANTFADWSMEAGDVVTVSRDGTGYSSPVGTMTLKWNGKQQIQISSEGSKEREPISRVSAREYARGGGGTSGMRGSQELYWEMFSEDGQLHATVHATAESLTSDYTKKIGDTDNALRGVITQTAERLISDYSDKISQTNSLISQTAGQIHTEVNNLDKRLSTQINETDSSLSLAVGRVKYNSTARYANKNAFPATGTAGVLYYANDTGLAYLYMPGTHSYELATVDEYGNANFVKAGEIAISINESGQTTAKLDATRVLAGRGALTIDDLELPDWMDTTEGLIATKATIVDLNALRARVGTLEADAITTQRLSSEILSAKGLVIRETLSFTYGQTSYTMATLMAGISAVQIVGPTNNLYTLQYKNYGNDAWQDAQSFSRATTLNGGWSSGRYTVTASPQGNTASSAIHSIVVDEEIAPAGTAVRAYLKVHYATGNPSSPSADTGFARQLVSLNGSTVYSNGQSNGWSLAYGKLSWPEAIDANTIKDNIVINHPTSGYNTDSNHTYYLYIDGDYACIKNAANSVVARIDDAHGSQLNIQDTKTSTISGSYTITPDEGYDAMKKVEVTVNKGTRITLTRGTYHSQSRTYTYSVELTDQGSSATAYLQ